MVFVQGLRRAIDSEMVEEDRDYPEHSYRPSRTFLWTRAFLWTIESIFVGVQWLDDGLVDNACGLMQPASPL